MKQEPTTFHHQQGSTLLVVLIIIAALSFLIGGLIMMSTSANRSVTNSLNQRTGQIEAQSTASKAMANRNGASLVNNAVQVTLPIAAERAFETNGTTIPDIINKAVVIERLQNMADRALCNSNISQNLAQADIKIENFRVHFSDRACGISLTEEVTKLRDGNTAALKLDPIQEEDTQNPTAGTGSKIWTIPFIMRWSVPPSETAMTNRIDMSQKGYIRLLTGKSTLGRYAVATLDGSINVNRNLQLNGNAYSARPLILDRLEGSKIAGSISSQCSGLRADTLACAPQILQPNNQVKPAIINNHGLPCDANGCLTAGEGGNLIAPQLTYENTNQPTHSLNPGGFQPTTIEIWYGPWESQYGGRGVPRDSNPTFTNPVSDDLDHHVPGNPMTQFVRACAPLPGSTRLHCIVHFERDDHPGEGFLNNVLRLNQSTDVTISGLNNPDQTSNVVFGTLRPGKRITIQSGPDINAGSPSAGSGSVRNRLLIGSSLYYTENPCADTNSVTDDLGILKGGMKVTCNLNNTSLLTLIGDVGISRNVKYTRNTSANMPTNDLTVEAQIISYNSDRNTLFGENNPTNARGEALDRLRILGNYTLLNGNANFPNSINTPSTDTGYSVLIDYDNRLSNPTVNPIALQLPKQVLEMEVVTGMQSAYQIYLKH